MVRSRLRCGMNSYIRSLFKIILAAVLVVVCVLGIIGFQHLFANRSKNIISTRAKTRAKDLLVDKYIPYNDFIKKLNNTEIDSVTIDLSQSIFDARDKSGNTYRVDNPKLSGFKEMLLTKDVKVKELTKVSTTETYLGLIFLMMVLFGAIVLIVLFGKSKGMGKFSNDKHSINVKAAEIKESFTLDNIAGNKSVKSDIKFIVDFLKNPEMYRYIGARLPKGIILYGPPGTGKTLTAKAVAGEANVPFFSMSGSDFVEVYVGVGAKRVRETFAEARKKAPCIIFIDELDAVGKHRGTDNNSERDQTINALLVELDGFNSEEGIIVIGATNKIEMLDEALIRPGRFDKHIAVPYPEYHERLEILELHARNKKLSEDVKLEAIAKITIGFSGAGLESLLNEAALIALSRSKPIIEFEDIDDAYYKILMKGDKKSLESVSRDQLTLTAWHEAGHALTAKLIAKRSVPKISVVPSTSGAGGATFIIPEKMGMHSRRDIINSIMISYSGRIGEYLLKGDYDMVTTGASEDIKQATSYIMGMIKEFGMTKEFGMLNINALEGMSDKVILDEAKRLSSKIYDETHKFLSDNIDKLKALAEFLMEKETIDEEQLDEILSN